MIIVNGRRRRNSFMKHKLIMKVCAFMLCAAMLFPGSVWAAQEGTGIEEEVSETAAQPEMETEDPAETEMSLSPS